MQLLGVTNQEVIPEYIAMKTPIYQKVMLVIIIFFFYLCMTTNIYGGQSRFMSSYNSLFCHVLIFT